MASQPEASRREFLAASAALLVLPRRQPRLRELRRAVRGRVFAPGDPGYERARLVFNTRFDGIRPPAVVRVRDTADVQAVVRWAGRHDVPLVVRSGGNAYNGASTSRDAVVVDVGGLDRFEVTATAGAAGLGVRDRSAAARTVVVAGPGLRNWELYRRLARRSASAWSQSRVHRSSRTRRNSRISSSFDGKLR